MSSVIVFLGIGVFIANAQSYTPLAPLPGTVTSAGKTDLPLYISGAIKLFIALGAALALLFAIIGGTQYVAASINPSAKSDAKEKVTNALVGLAIILTSYLLLNSINPKLVHFSLLLKPVVPKALEVYESTQPTTKEESGPLNSAEKEVRDRLASGGVYVTRTSACQGLSFQDFAKTYTGMGCTTMEGLPEKAIAGVISLKKACGNSCKIFITGGTEAGHVTHGVGRASIDLSYNDPTLNAYIINNKVGQLDKPCGVKSALHYYRDGATYVAEQNPLHWHVCY